MTFLIIQTCFLKVNRTEPKNKANAEISTQKDALTVTKFLICFEGVWFLRHMIF